MELAAAAVAADGLMSAWTREQAVVSMLVDMPSECGALAAGMAVLAEREARPGLPLVHPMVAAEPDQLDGADRYGG